MAMIGKFGTVEEAQVKLDKALGFVEKFLVDDFIVGKTVTVADLSFMTILETVNALTPFPSEKYPKIVAYIKKLTKLLPYFEEINRKGIETLVTYIKSQKK